DLRATDRHAMRARAVELDHGAIALLADETDMGDRHDVAAMHPEEQAGVELGFCFGDRPGAHPLADAVMHPGVMRIGPDAADFRRIDEVGAVGALDRQPRYRRGSRRLAEPA